MYNLEVSQPNQMQLRIAQTVACTEAEGPGKRFAVWLQGCPLRCVECCNPEMLSFDGGTLTPVESLVVEIEKAVQRDGIEGITLIGGEPFAHATGAAELARRVRGLGLSVMIFSGFTLEELREMHEPAVGELLDATDLLIDGPYDRTQPDTSRRWIGSRNQRIHFLSDRYAADDPRWAEPDTLEIRLQGNELTINGFPAAAAKTVWKRIERTSEP